MDITGWFAAGKIHCFYIGLIILNLALPVIAQTSTELELSAIAEFSSVKLKQDKWHNVLPIGGADNNYFISTESGKLYHLDNELISTPPFLDLKNTLKKANIIALTAVVLDPSFNYRDRNGYNTFYTAHVEVPKQKGSINSPVTSNNSKKNSPLNELGYEAVIMRWQLHKSLHKEISIVNQHEVIRIPIHDKTEAINQLSFNPYTESWHDDFGLLYALLAKTNMTQKSDEALYSGVILRIKPERFGLQSYTIPVSNPFIKQADIRNEIIFMAGRKIINFDWVKKSTSPLLIQLENAEKNQFVQTTLGADWRNSFPSNALLTNNFHDKSSNKTIYYRGRELKNLWGQILQLNQEESGWKLQALTLNSASQLQTQATEKLSYHDITPANSTAAFSLHKNSNNELMLLEHNQQILYQINAVETVTSKVTPSKEIALENNSNAGFIAFIIILTVLLAAFWYFKHVSKKRQHFLYLQWSNFEINSATESLSLFKRHNKVVEKVIKISSLKSSDILLNDKVISVISANAEHYFSNAIEEQVFASFTKEHRIKMIDDKQRKIQLRLTDNNNIVYIFHLYFRVGNTRHTKLKYNTVINKVIDWNWLFSSVINAESTEKRKIRVKQTVEKPVSLSNAKIRKAAIIKPLKSELTDNNSDALSAGSSAAISNNDDTTSKDTELVAALDKLVEMKKQGYLNESEFNAAKAKILKSLANQ